jgi:hypothetical protein
MHQQQLEHHWGRLFGPGLNFHLRVHHQEQQRLLHAPLTWGLQQRQKKHQHQQKACRELRQQQQGQWLVSFQTPSSVR